MSLGICLCFLFLSIANGYNNSSLLLTTIDHMMKHDQYSELFQNILHPILTQHPELFNAIVHKILLQQPDSQFCEYFVITATRAIFDEYITFHSQNLNNSINSNEIWKLLKMIDHDYDWLLSHSKTVSFFRNISFDINGDNKFHVHINIHSNIIDFVHAQDTSIDKINWSEIPRFINSITAHYQSNASITIDLSSIDSSCKINKLIVAIRNGIIILPDYQMPSSLETLALVHKKGIGTFAIDFPHLWTICSNIKEVAIYQKQMKLSDFDKFEQMKNIKVLEGNFCMLDLRKVTHMIITRYKKLQISSEYLIVRSTCSLLSWSVCTNLLCMKLQVPNQIAVGIQTRDVSESSLDAGGVEFVMLLMCLTLVTIAILVFAFTVA